MTQQLLDSEEIVTELDISHLVIEDDTPVDNFQSAQQQRLLVEPLYQQYSFQHTFDCVRASRYYKRINPDSENLKKSFAEVKKEQLPIERECKILQEANRFDLCKSSFFLTNFCGSLAF